MSSGQAYMIVQGIRQDSIILYHIIQLNFYFIFSLSVKDSNSSLGQIKSIVTGQEIIKDFILRLLRVSVMSVV